MNIEDIKSQYPDWQVNALGGKDMDNIRALISEIERLTASLEASRRCHVEAETALTALFAELGKRYSKLLKARPRR